jgi:hypothetical protein
MRKLFAIALSGLAATGLVLSMASPAAAAVETNYASLTTAPLGWLGGCQGYGPVWACFVPHGDYIYIEHQQNADLTPYIDWNNWLRKPDGNWALYRTGYCFSNLGPGTWGRCNKDFYEDGNKNAWGGYGSEISFRVCASSSNCSDWIDVPNFE